MLSGLLSAVSNLLSGLLGSVVDLLGGLLGGLTQTFVAVPAVPAAPFQPQASGDVVAAPAQATSLVETVMDGMAEGSGNLLEAALSGTDRLVETGIVDSAHALNDLARGIAGITETTITTNYRADGTIASVVEHVSHGPGAAVMMHFVSEVLAPQVSGLGMGVSQLMGASGSGVEVALANLTAYDLNYSVSASGAGMLVLDHAVS